MAKAVTVAVEVSATEGGATVLDMADTFQAAFDDVNQYTLRIPNGADKFFAVQGTDITGETDPMVLASYQGHYCQVCSSPGYPDRRDCGGGDDWAGGFAARQFGCRYDQVEQCVRPTGRYRAGHMG